MGQILAVTHRISEEIALLLSDRLVGDWKIEGGLQLGTATEAKLRTPSGVDLQLLPGVGGITRVGDAGTTSEGLGGSGGPFCRRAARS